jgi:hypothetical protein
MASSCGQPQPGRGQLHRRGPGGQHGRGQRHRGVLVTGPQSGNNFIGGTANGAGNVIAGNDTANRLFGGGVILERTSGTQVLGNRIGVGAGGGVGNDQNGVLIESSRRTVVGTGPAAMNVISGNEGPGVHITGSGATSTFVQGNRIGTSADGTGAIPNTGDGVFVESGADFTLIGGNLISGNGLNGVHLASGANHTDVLGNVIGLNTGGTAVLANGGDGVLIEGARTRTTHVGLGTTETRNVIAGNMGNGVEVKGADDTTIAGNLIGTNQAGAPGLGNGQNGINLQGVSRAGVWAMNATGEKTPTRLQQENEVATPPASPAAEGDTRRRARSGLAVYEAVLVPLSAVFEALMIADMRRLSRSPA